MAIRKVIFGDKATCDAVYMALENTEEIARDDGEEETRDAILASLTALDVAQASGEYPIVLHIKGFPGDQILDACEQVAEDPELYELESAAIAYDEGE